MPKSLTEKQKTVVQVYANTGDATYAAWKAGYHHPETLGPRMVKLPALVDAIEARRAAREDLDKASPAVVKEHVDRLLGRRGSPPSHGEFAKLVSPFYKLLSDRGFAGHLNDRDPSEMTGDELRAALDVMRAEADRLESAIADRALPVDVAPEPTPVTDLFGD